MSINSWLALILGMVLGWLFGWLFERWYFRRKREPQGQTGTGVETAVRPTGRETPSVEAGVAPASVETARAAAISQAEPLPVEEPLPGDVPRLDHDNCTEIPARDKRQPGLLRRRPRTAPAGARRYLSRYVMRPRVRS